jgi:hypothetical protein
MGTSCERILATVDEATTGLAGVELPGDVWAGILADLRQQSPRGHTVGPSGSVSNRPGPRWAGSRSP